MKPFVAALALSAIALLPVRSMADPINVQVRPSPEIGRGAWINSAPTTIAANRGKVVVLLFWTRECINCEHNLGYWNEWASKYANSNVAVISVHTPETGFERSLPALRSFVHAEGLQFPVVTDNGMQTWNAFGVSYWPTEIPIDKQGRIRYEFGGELNWQGSGEYRTVEADIERLRRENVQ